ncbi:MAG: class I SAM-dependent methyltransferase [Myxococcales bacterium]|nr:class I SAM-dependent methyltransferase [Myxococcales bacterium]
MTALVCPRCRRADDDGVHLATVEPCDTGLRCLGCGSGYPVIDGIPVVARDAEALLAEDTPASDALAAIYARSWSGPLQEWLRKTVPAGALELGGGTGVRSNTVVLDRSLAMLRRGRSAGQEPAGTWICGDVLDPPFLPASFGCVVLANVLDILHDPNLAFRQAVALTAVGGAIVVTCPYAFTQSGPDCRLEPFPEHVLHGGFGAVEAGVLRLESCAELDWPIRTTDRLTQVHRTDALVFRRLSLPGEQ